MHSHVKLLPILTIFFLLFFYSGRVFGQDSTVCKNLELHPYFGLSINGSDNVPQFGFGMEIGARYGMFYLGAEYGIYGFTIFDPIKTYDPITRMPGNQPPDRIVSEEQYYGFHAGVIIKNTIWVGVAFLWGSTTMYHPAPVDSTFRSNSGFNFALHAFNVGPDIRFTLSDHLTMDLAYTIRREIKFGIAYLP